MENNAIASARQKETFVPQFNPATYTLRDTRVRLRVKRSRLLKGERGKNVSSREKERSAMQRRINVSFECIWQ